MHKPIRQTSSTSRKRGIARRASALVLALSCAAFLATTHGGEGAAPHRAAPTQNQATTAADSTSAATQRQRQRHQQQKNHPTLSLWRPTGSFTVTPAPAPSQNKLQITRPASEHFANKLTQTASGARAILTGAADAASHAAAVQSRLHQSIIADSSPLPAIRQNFRGYLSNKLRHAQETLRQDAIAQANALIRQTTQDAIAAQPYVKNINLDLQTSLGNRKWQTAVDALGPLRQTQQDVIAWQLRGYAAEQSSYGGNLGLIYRRATQINLTPKVGEALAGINAFLDYEQHGDSEADFLRWSLGTEYKTSDYALFANKYWAITDAQTAPNGQIYYSRDGYDLEYAQKLATGRIEIDGGLTYYNWQGDYGQQDDTGLILNLKFQAAAAGGLKLNLNYDMPENSNSGDFGGAIAYSRKIGAPPNAARAPATGAPFNPRDHFFVPVKREYSQRISAAGEAAAGQNAIRIVAAPGATAGVQAHFAGQILTITSTTDPQAIAAATLTLHSPANGGALVTAVSGNWNISLAANSTLLLHDDSQGSANYYGRLSLAIGIVRVDRDSGNIPNQIESSGTNATVIANLGGTEFTYEKQADGNVNITPEEGVLIITVQTPHPITAIATIVVVQQNRQISMGLASVVYTHQQITTDSGGVPVTVTSPTLQLDCSNHQGRNDQKRLYDSAFTQCQNDYRVANLAAGAIVTLQTASSAAAVQSGALAAHLVLHGIAQGSDTLISVAGYNALWPTADGVPIAPLPQGAYYVLSTPNTITVIRDSSAFGLAPPAAQNATLNINQNYILLRSGSAQDPALACPYNAGSAPLAAQTAGSFSIIPACGAAVQATMQANIGSRSGYSNTETIQPQSGGNGQYQYILTPANAPAAIQSAANQAIYNLAGPQSVTISVFSATPVTTVYNLQITPANAQAAAVIAAANIAITAEIQADLAFAAQSDLTIRTRHDSNQALVTLHLGGVINRNVLTYALASADSRFALATMAGAPPQAIINLASALNTEESRALTITAEENHGAGDPLNDSAQITVNVHFRHPGPITAQINLTTPVNTPGQAIIGGTLFVANNNQTNYQYAAIGGVRNQDPFSPYGGLADPASDNYDYTITPTTPFAAGIQYDSAAVARSAANLRIGATAPAVGYHAITISIDDNHANTTPAALAVTLQIVPKLAVAVAAAQAEINTDQAGATLATIQAHATNIGKPFAGANPYAYSISGVNGPNANLASFQVNNQGEIILSSASNTINLFLTVTARIQDAISDVADLALSVAVYAPLNIAIAQDAATVYHTHTTGDFYTPAAAVVGGKPGYTYSHSLLGVTNPAVLESHFTINQNTGALRLNTAAPANVIATLVITVTDSAQPSSTRQFTVIINLTDNAPAFPAIAPRPTIRATHTGDVPGAIHAANWSVQTAGPITYALGATPPAGVAIDQNTAQIRLTAPLANPAIIQTITVPIRAESTAYDGIPAALANVTIVALPVVAFLAGGVPATVTITTYHSQQNLFSVQASRGSSPGAYIYSANDSTRYIITTLGIASLDQQTNAYTVASQTTLQIIAQDTGIFSPDTATAAIHLNISDPPALALAAQNTRPNHLTGMRGQVAVLNASGGYTQPQNPYTLYMQPQNPNFAIHHTSGAAQATLSLIASITLQTTLAVTTILDDTHQNTTPQTLAFTILISDMFAFQQQTIPPISIRTVQDGTTPVLTLRVAGNQGNAVQYALTGDSRVRVTPASTTDNPPAPAVIAMQNAVTNPATLNLVLTATDQMTNAADNVVITAHITIIAANPGAITAGIATPAAGAQTDSSNAAGAVYLFPATHTGPIATIPGVRNIGLSGLNASGNYTYALINTPPAGVAVSANPLANDGTGSAALTINTALAAGAYTLSIRISDDHTANDPDTIVQVTIRTYSPLALSQTYTASFFTSGNTGIAAQVALSGGGLQRALTFSNNPNGALAIAYNATRTQADIRLATPQTQDATIETDLVLDDGPDGADPVTIALTITNRNYPQTYNSQGTVLIGGGENSSNDNIWRNANADLSQPWTQQSSVPAGAANRRRHAMLEFNGHVYIIGGENSGGTAQGDIYRRSADGVWTNVASIAPRAHPNAVVHNRQLYVFGGYANNTNLKDVWRSPDGENWTRESETAYTPGLLHGAVGVINGTVWAASGSDATRDNQLDSNAKVQELWYSTDMLTWQRSTGNDSPQRIGWGPAFAVFNGKLFIAGGVGNGSGGGGFNRYLQWWDGSQWGEITTSDSNSIFQSWGAAMVHYQDQLVIMGGRDHGREVWASATPEILSSWTEIDTTAEFQDRRRHAAVVANPASIPEALRAPLILNPIPSVELTHANHAGSVIATATYSAGAAPVTYQLAVTGPNAANASFQINATNGEITFNSATGQNNLTLTLNVTGTDSATPAETDSTSFIATIIAPLAIQISQSRVTVRHTHTSADFYTPSNVFIGGKAPYIHAIQSVNSHVAAIQQSHFTIPAPATGALRLAGTPPIAAAVTIAIQVSDSSAPAQQATYQVIANLTDNGIQTNTDALSLNVRTGDGGTAAANNPITALTATWQSGANNDSPHGASSPFGPITYSLDTTDASPLQSSFSLNISNGAIHLTAALAAVATPATITLNIIATAADVPGTPPLTVPATIHIINPLAFAASAPVSLTITTGLADTIYNIADFTAQNAALNGFSSITYAVDNAAFVMDGPILRQQAAFASPRSQGIQITAQDNLFFNTQIAHTVTIVAINPQPMAFTFPRLRTTHPVGQPGLVASIHIEGGLRHAPYSANLAGGGSGPFQILNIHSNSFVGTPPDFVLSLTATIVAPATLHVTVLISDSHSATPDATPQISHTLAVTLISMFAFAPETHPITYVRTAFDTGALLTATHIGQQGALTYSIAGANPSARAANFTAAAIQVDGESALQLNLAAAIPIDAANPVQPITLTLVAADAGPPAANATIIHQIIAADPGPITFAVDLSHNVLRGDGIAAQYITPATATVTHYRYPLPAPGADDWLLHIIEPGNADDLPLPGAPQSGITNGSYTHVVQGAFTGEGSIAPGYVIQNDNDITSPATIIVTIRSTHQHTASNNGRTDTPLTLVFAHPATLSNPATYSAIQTIQTNLGPVLTLQAAINGDSSNAENRLSYSYTPPITGMDLGAQDGILRITAPVAPAQYAINLQITDSFLNAQINQSLTIHATNAPLQAPLQTYRSHAIAGAVLASASITGGQGALNIAIVPASAAAVINITAPQSPAAPGPVLITLQAAADATAGQYAFALSITDSAAATLRQTLVVANTLQIINPATAQQYSSGDIFLNGPGTDYDIWRNQEPDLNQWGISHDGVFDGEPGAQDNGKFLAYNGALYHLGGGIIGFLRGNDVWQYTTDNGWQYIAANNPNAPNRFTQRHSHQAVVFNNRMWVFGGYAGSSSSNVITDDIAWSSVNGVYWTSHQMTNFPDWANFGAAVLNGTVFIAGHRNGETYRTTDMITWTKGPDTTLGTEDIGDAMAVHNGTIYIFGGYDDNFDDEHRYVQWWDPAANAWQRTNQDPLPPARDKAALVSRYGQLVLIAGEDESADRDDIWVTSTPQDHASWQRITDSAPTPAGPARAAVFDASYIPATQRLPALSVAINRSASPVQTNATGIVATLALQGDANGAYVLSLPTNPSNALSLYHTAGTHQALLSLHTAQTAPIVLNAQISVDDQNNSATPAHTQNFAITIVAPPLQPDLQDFLANHAPVAGTIASLSVSGGHGQLNIALIQPAATPLALDYTAVNAPAAALATLRLVTATPGAAIPFTLRITDATPSTPQTADIARTLNILNPATAQHHTSGNIILMADNEQQAWQNTGANLAQWQNADPGAVGNYKDTKILVFNGALYKIGGFDSANSDSPSNDVWRSADGQTWTPIAAHNAAAPNRFSPRGAHAAIVFNNRMWVFGGHTNPSNESGTRITDDLAWYSYNGTDWFSQQMTGFPDITSFFGVGAAVLNGTVFLAGGGTRQAYTSTDMQTWSAAPNTPRGTKNLGDSIAIHNGTLYAFGGADDTTGGDTLARLQWWDGSAWQAQDLAPSIPARESAALLSRHGRLIIIGGTTADGDNRADIWSSATPQDPASWQQDVQSGLYAAGPVRAAVFDPAFHPEALALPQLAILAPAPATFSTGQTGDIAVLNLQGVADAAQYNITLSQGAPAITLDYSGQQHIATLRLAQAQSDPITLAAQVILNDGVALTPPVTANFAVTIFATLIMEFTQYQPVFPANVAGQIAAISLSGAPAQFLALNSATPAAFNLINDTGAQYATLNLIAQPSPATLQATLVLNSELSLALAITIQAQDQTAQTYNTGDIHLLATEIVQNNNAANLSTGWTQRANPATNGAKLVTHNGALYLIGGRNADGISSQVWRSADGVVWGTLPDAPFSARWRSHNAIVHNQAIFVFGGDSSDKNLWRTYDGQNWQAIDPGANPVTDSENTYAIPLVAQGATYYASGIGANTADYLNVWSSQDLQTWTDAGDLPHSGRGAAAAVHNGTAYFIGGYVSASADHSRVQWLSGGTWQSVDANFPARSNAALINRNGILILIGGAEANTAARNDIWVSSNPQDPNSWQQIIADGHSIFPQITHPAAVVYDSTYTPDALALDPLAFAKTYQLDYATSGNIAELAHFTLSGGAHTDHALNLSQNPGNNLTIHHIPGAPGATLSLATPYATAQNFQTNLLFTDGHADLHTLTIALTIINHNYPQYVNTQGTLIIAGGDDANQRDVWYTNNADLSQTWTKTTDPTASGYLREPALAVFNGAAYLIGGHDGTSAQNIIYRKEGDSWTNTGASIGARRAANAVVFQNQLWVFGGESDTAILADVWRTADGQNWHLHQNDSTLYNISIYAAAVAAINGTVWLAGGTRAPIGESRNATGNPNDRALYYTTDMINWTQHPAQVPSGQEIGWRPLGAAFNGKFFVAGGQPDGNTKSVLRWFDGTQWHSASGAPIAFERWGGIMLHHNDQLIISGGRVRALAERSDRSNDIWASKTPQIASSWTRVTENATFSDRRYIAAAILGSPAAVPDAQIPKAELRLINNTALSSGNAGAIAVIEALGLAPLNLGLAAGHPAELSLSHQPGQSRATVFVTTPYTQTQNFVQNITLQDGRGDTDTQQINVTNHDHPQYQNTQGTIIVAGSRTATQQNLWYATDPASWTLLSDAAENNAANGNALGMIEFNGAAYIIGGRPGGDDDSPTGAVYRRQSSGAWVSVAVIPPRAFPNIVVKDNQLWVFGGYNRALAEGSRALQDVWTTSDGEYWTQHSATGYTPALYHAAHAIINGRVYVAGGADGAAAESLNNSVNNNELWHSADLVNWTKGPDAPSPIGWGAAGANYNGLFYVAGGVSFNSGASTRNDTLQWYNGTAWQTAAQTAQSPAFQKWGAALVHYGQRLLIIAGNGPTVDSDQIWASHTPQVAESWRQIAQTTPLQARSRHAALVINPNNVLAEQTPVLGLALDQTAPYQSHIVQGSNGNIAQIIHTGAFAPANISLSAQGALPAGFTVTQNGAALQISVTNPQNIGAYSLTIQASHTTPGSAVPNAQTVLAFQVIAPSASGYNTGRIVAINFDRTGFAASADSDQYTNDNSSRLDQWQTARVKSIGIIPYQLPPALAVLNGTIFATGGTDGLFSDRVDDVYASDDGGDSWSQIASDVYPGRNRHLHIAHNNALWIIGGSGFGGALQDLWRSADGVTWTPSVPLPHLLYSASYGIIGGTVYLVGGLDGNNSATDVVNQTYLSSPDMINWTQNPIPAAIQPHIGQSMQHAVLNGTLFIMGGNSQQSGSRLIAFNGAQWSVTDLNNGIDDNVAIALSRDGNLIVFDSTNNDIWYSPTPMDADSWQKQDGPWTTANGADAIVYDPIAPIPAQQEAAAAILDIAATPIQTVFTLNAALIAGAPQNIATLALSGHTGANNPYTLAFLGAPAHFSIVHQAATDQATIQMDFSAITDVGDYSATVIVQDAGGDTKYLPDHYIINVQTIPTTLAIAAVTTATRFTVNAAITGLRQVASFTLSAHPDGSSGLYALTHNGGTNFHIQHDSAATEATLHFNFSAAAGIHNVAVTVSDAADASYITSTETDLNIILDATVGASGDSPIAPGFYVWEFRTNSGLTQDEHFWHSPDGVTWSTLSLLPATTSYPTGFYWNDRFWILGGRSGTDYLNDVYYSTDGKTWIQGTDAPFAIGTGRAPVIHNGNLYLMGGRDSNTFSEAAADTWTTGDGLNWTMLANGAPWSTAGNDSRDVIPISHGGTLWVLDGDVHADLGLNANSPRANVWYSTNNGASFTQAATSGSPTFSAMQNRILYHDGKFWIYGGTRSQAPVNEIWSSANLTVWTRETNNAPVTQYRGATGRFGGYTYLLFGTNENYHAQDDVWRSADGQTNWQLVASNVLNTPDSQSFLFDYASAFVNEALTADDYQSPGPAAPALQMDVTYAKATFPAGQAQPNPLATLVLSGGAPPYAISIVGAPPANFTLIHDSAQNATALISLITPPAAGAYTLTIAATDGTNVPDIPSQLISLTFANLPALAANAQTHGVMAYQTGSLNFTLQATGGSGSGYTFSTQDHNLTIAANGALAFRHDTETFIYTSSPHTFTYTLQTHYRLTVSPAIANITITDGSGTQAVAQLQLTLIQNTTGGDGQGATTGSLYILGGSEENTSNAEVVNRFISTDGNTLTEHTGIVNANVYTDRKNAGAVVLNNTVFVIGGGKAKSSEDPRYYNNLFSSQDARVWTQHGDDTTSTSNTDLAGGLPSKAVVLKGTIYLMSQLDWSSPANRRILSSTDGIVWTTTQINISNFDSAIDQSSLNDTGLAVLGEHIYLFRRHAFAQANNQNHRGKFNAYYSADGQNFTRMSDANLANFRLEQGGNNHQFNTFVYNDRLFVRLDSESQFDHLYSTAGPDQPWIRHENTPGLPHYNQFAYYNGHVYSIGGALNTSQSFATNEIWRFNGLTWQNIPALQLPQTTFAPAVFIYNNTP